MGTREVFVDGQADVTIEADDLYGDVQITGGAISGTFSCCADVSDNFEWQYDECDITEMLDDESADLEFLWEWLDVRGVKVWAEFLRYFLNQPMNPNTAYLPTVCSRAERAKLLIDAVKAAENLLSEEEEKDATKV